MLIFNILYVQVLYYFNIYVSHKLIFYNIKLYQIHHTFHFYQQQPN